MVKHKSSQSQSIEEDNFKSKYGSLIEDFLELQKEYVSNKKKLLKTKQKRDILSTEIRFLRQRHRYLMAMKSQNLQLQQDPAPLQNSSMQTDDARKLLGAEKKLKNGTSRRVKKKVTWQDQKDAMV